MKTIIIPEAIINVDRCVPSRSQWRWVWTGKSQEKAAGPSAPPIWSHLNTKRSAVTYVSASIILIILKSENITSPKTDLCLTNRGIAILQLLIGDVDFNPWTWGKRWHLDLLQEFHHSCTISAARHAVRLGKQVGCCHYIVHVQVLQKKALCYYRETA